jgi:ABC-2 type transport system ATP-binding protein
MEVVTFEGVRKVYPDLETARFTSLRRTPADQRRLHVAVRGLTFTLVAGEGVGILGEPESGRTTVLHLISGVLRADAGKVLVRGRATGLVSAGAGLSNDFSVHTNVVFGLVLLGERQDDAEAAADEVIDYAELTDEADTKLRDLTPLDRRRLGYAIALFTNPTVFLADEDLLLGSQAMRDGALDRMAHYPDRSHALVVATNSTKYLRRLCQRALVLRGGQLVFDGPLDEGIAEYRRTKQRPKKSEE